MHVFTKRSGVFAITLILLLANGIIIHTQLAMQRERRVWVNHTRQVALELAETESLLKDAETGQRGFLYTNDAKYLVPYERATSQIAAHIDNLQLLIADPGQQARLSALRDLTGRKLGELALTISFAQSGRSGEAKAIVVADAGKLIMDNIRGQIGEMQRAQDTLDVAGSVAYENSVRRSILCIYLANVLAALGLIVVAYYILHEMELRTKHAAQLLEREEWFRITLTSLGDAVIATDKQGHVNYLNPVAERLIGVNLQTAYGRPIVEVFSIFDEASHESEENPVAKVLELGRIVGSANHTVLQNSDGSLIPIEDSAAPIRDIDGKLIGAVLVFRDATRQRKSQDLLRKSERLISAARMSATMAHEINNPLDAIGNLIFLVKGTLGLSSHANEYLDMAEQELERVSHISRQTLGFYRESRMPESINVPTLMEYVLKLHSNKFNTRGITVRREFEDCPIVQGLSGELKQAMSNLVANAADAVDENGTISVKLTCIGEAAGKFVRVVIEDDGPGIAPENMEKVFEAFFTTKKDVGTGLGLWVTKEIIERHRGTIQIATREKSTLGGAQFTVLLPCFISSGSADSVQITNTILVS